MERIYISASYFYLLFLISSSTFLSLFISNFLGVVDKWRLTKYWIFLNLIESIYKKNYIKSHTAPDPLYPLKKTSYMINSLLLLYKWYFTWNKRHFVHSFHTDMTIQTSRILNSLQGGILNYFSFLVPFNTFLSLGFWVI